MLLLGDKSVSPGYFNDHQKLDHEEWNVFKHSGLLFPHVSIDSFFPKINEVRQIAKLTNLIVTAMSKSKFDNFMVKSRINELTTFIVI